MHKYKVTCLNCKDSDVLTFDDNRHLLIHSDKIMQTPITAVRWRPDLKWGFECRCGNYNLLAEEEKKDFDKLVAGSPDRLSYIVNILKKKDIKKFEMVGV